MSEVRNMPIFFQDWNLIFSVMSLISEKLLQSKRGMVSVVKIFCYGSNHLSSRLAVDLCQKWLPVKPAAPSHSGN